MEAQAEVSKAETTTARRPHDIPSLDGLRAVSIAIVVLSHTRSLLPPRLVNAGLFRYAIGGGLHGVQIFFVLSGYLITTLLQREDERTGAVSFRRFYARRALRIFPAFYVYLAVVGVLWIGGAIPEHGPSFLAAATYTMAYLAHPQGWPLLHTWSLSVEEQFYLLWPALLVFAMRRAISLRIVWGVLAAMPAVRIVLASVMAQTGGVIVMSGSIDMLMTGCLLALMKDKEVWQRFRQRYLHGWSVAALLAVGLVAVPYAGVKIVHGVGGAAVIALGTTVTALAIGSLVAYVVERPRSIAGRFLNLRPMRHVGLISYSIYLWQQLITAESAQFGYGVYALILGAGELSFQLIERPVTRLRERLKL